HDLGGALGEGTGRARRDPDPQHSGTVGGQVLGQRLYRLVRFLLRLDDHHAAISVPGQGDGTHPEVLEQRKIERRVVLQCGGGGGGHARCFPGAARPPPQKPLRSFTLPPHPALPPPPPPPPPPL